tara:strand:+ start:1380 stop:2264 length:885 start_codon:yes stop_codon:yes gene_type:complete
MSRNRNRIQAPQQPTKKQEAPTPPPQIVEQNDNPFGLSFVVPTEIIKLPSGGNLYEESSPLCGLTEVEVKAVTAAQEDIMINDSFIREGIVFDKLIDSIMITPGIQASDMMYCDKVAVLMSARKSGYGDEVLFSTSCESCGHEYEMPVLMSEMLEKTSENSFNPKTTDEWEYSEETGTFSFTLPTTELEMEIRLAGTNEIDNLDASRVQRQKLNLPFNETIEFLRMVIVSAQGITDRTSINKLTEILPAADARLIRSIHNRNLPNISTTHETTCPKCDTTQEKEVPFSLGWFWS